PLMPMSPQRRTALVSVAIVFGLFAVKLAVGLVTHSLGLVSEGLHSGTDLVAALLTFFALGVAVRPADPGHQYGHGKAEHLAALGEAVVLVLASLFIAVRAVTHLVSATQAAGLVTRNVAVLMDRAPAAAHDAALGAIGEIEPAIDLRRLRLRQAAGRHFADVVIGISPEAAVGQGHAAADAVESAVRRALPEADVVVHVEPRGTEAEIRERAHAAALGVRRVREIHNVSVLNVDGATEVSLHLKLPGDLPLDEAHGGASQVEHARRGARARKRDRRADPPRAPGHRRRARPHRAVVLLEDDAEIGR